MNYEEKAQELYDFYFPLVEAYTVEGQHDNTKKCAQHHCDGIIEALKITTGHLTLNDLDFSELMLDFDHWQQIKESLNKL